MSGIPNKPAAAYDMPPKPYSEADLYALAPLLGEMQRAAGEAHAENTRRRKGKVGAALKKMDKAALRLRRRIAACRRNAGLRS